MWDQPHLVEPGHALSSLPVQGTMDTQLGSLAVHCLQDPGGAYLNVKTEQMWTLQKKTIPKRSL